MLMIVLEAVPNRLRGELTRWLTQASPQVFIGRVTPAVRDLLWERCIAGAETGRVVQAWSVPQAERGFEFRIHGHEDLRIVDIEGVLFPCIQDAAWKEARDRFKLGKSPTDT